MNTKSTDLDRNFIDYKDCPDFTRRFKRDISICVGVGFLATLGLIAVVVNAEAIDRFMSELAKKLFL